MKKYMAVWGAMFFCVICLSLYLMLETLSTSPSRYPDVDAEALIGFEKKIDGIEEDIKRNREIIKQIKDAVKDVAKGDQQSIEKLQKVLDSQNEQLQKNKDKLEALQSKETPDKNKDAHKPTVKVQEPERNVIEMQQPAAVKDISNIEYNPGTWRGSYAVLWKEVSIAEGMCSWSEAPVKSADIQMEKVIHELPFDNPDGGAWKQGWKVEYQPNHWNAGNMLKVFVVPHSHNDPGWVKTFDQYYEQQTRHIFNNMLAKLEQYPKMRFMYAEISFFHIWWNEINEDKRNRVKKLIQEGRLEIITGGWVMSDEANAHYFAMLDQLLEGHQWLEGTLGVKPSAGWAIDPFGHSPTMAYLLRRSGLNNMLVQRIHYAVKKYLAKNRNLEFMWRQNWDHEGNTDMFCHMMPFYSYDIPHTCGPEPAICCQFDFRRLPGSSYTCPWHIPPQVITSQNVEERAKMIIDQWKKKASLYRTNSVFVPLGDDFRYDKEEEWDQQYVNYQNLFEYMNAHPELGVQAQFGTLSDYFNSIYEEFKVKPGEKPEPIPTLTGDFYTYADKDDHYWSGYFTSRPFQKNLDRVMESHLRAAEIIFSLAQTAVRRNGHSKFPSTSFMEKLVNARRNLGLFQHHDAITGTAKDHVVEDYGKKLLQSLQDTKIVIKECATYLTLDTKSDYTLDAEWFDVDETRADHDALPVDSVIQLGDENDGAPRPVMFYNSLAQSRDQVVKIYVSCPDVRVKDSDGKTVLTQVEPVWEQHNVISSTKYGVAFRLTVPALGIVKYTVQRVVPNSNPSSIAVSVLIFNADSNSVMKAPPFSVEKAQGSDITMENPFLKATFAGSNGLLQTVLTKENGELHNTKLEFVTYGTKTHNGDRSGAYLFLPDGPARAYFNHNPPMVNFIQGPIVSEVHVHFDLVTHIVRLYNSSGADGISLDMQNIVDITSRSNTEIVVRITTDVQNKDNEFYTDLNGFQMRKHKMYDKLTIQGNVYPMPTMAFIEDEKHRFSILSANSLGFSNLKPGMMDVFLDRRLNQDDSRGLGQGVTDSKKTPSRFKLLLENRNKGLYNKDQVTTFPSLLGHMTSLQLIHPVFVTPVHSKHSNVEFPKQSNFSPMRSELPCDVHLLNLRTMQNKDDAPDRLVPKSTAAMFLHRLGVDCSFPNKGLMCKDATGETVLTKENGELHNTKLEFVTYGTKTHNGDRSGAYLFLPDGPARAYFNQNPPKVNIIQGPIVSEVHVHFDLVTHIVRLYNSSGADGISLDMQNIVDITSRSNTEIVVRITTDVQNKDNEFYTDLNGFQMRKHKMYDKLTIQGNVYPMPTMAFIEDEKHRFSILSANSLGFSNLKPGMMDVFLDRRLNQDDSRGLGQGVTDSKKTPSRFKLLLENRNKGLYNKDQVTTFPSLLGHMTSLQLIHPVFVTPVHSKHSNVEFPKQSNFSPMRSELPCDVHLLNLRTMQNKDDAPDRLVPKSTAAMFLHRLGVDCSFPNKGLMCKDATGEVVLANIFKEIRTDVAQQVSLTLMYDEKELDTSELLDLEPMEISSFVVTLQ